MVLGQGEAKETDDPFVQASSAEEPNLFDEHLRAEYPDMYKEEPVDEDQSSVIPTKAESIQDKKPKPLDFSKPEKTKTVGGKRAGLALLLSMISVGASGYFGYQQMLQSKNLTRETEDVSKIIGSISEDLNTNTLSLSTLQTRTAVLETEAQRVPELASKVSSHEQKISQLQSSSAQREKTASELSVALRDSNEKLAALNASYDNLSQQQRQIAQVARQKVAQPESPVRSRPSSPPAPIIATALGSAVIESMDSWGHNQYVVMMEPSGDWISVRRGTTYDGWLFTGANNDYAIFTRGDRTMKVRIGG
ncbi:hypothetical protein C0068_16680 [Zhongshania marina]|uniref:Uncharacterized protein n=2 Tax=Zhongshania marina TaxID=2304603 RepID=A0A2S4HD04_9GAMM|nr:hypothetical protein C0068_16680 [Marortus luteolus]